MGLNDTFAPVVAPLAQSLSERGPDELRGLLAIMFVFIALGFCVGVIGHLVQSKTVVGMGITMAMIGTVAFVVAVFQYG